jgi:hypothetical protein
VAIWEAISAKVEALHVKSKLIDFTAWPVFNAYLMDLSLCGGAFFSECNAFFVRPSTTRSGPRARMLVIPLNAPGVDQFLIGDLENKRNSPAKFNGSILEIMAFHPHTTQIIEQKSGRIFAVGARARRSFPINAGHQNIPD